MEDDKYEILIASIDYTRYNRVATIWQQLISKPK